MFCSPVPAWGQEVPRRTPPARSLSRHQRWSCTGSQSWSYWLSAPSSRLVGSQQLTHSRSPGSSDDTLLDRRGRICKGGEQEEFGRNRQKTKCWLTRHWIVKFRDLSFKSRSLNHTAPLNVYHRLNHAIIDCFMRNATPFWFISGDDLTS